VVLTSTYRFIYDPGSFFDEALTPDGRARPHYANALAELEQLDLDGLPTQMREAAESIGAAFRVEGTRRPFVVDPVPRIIEAGEWDLLERGLSQRASALNRFIADVYSGREIFEAGVVPGGVARGADDLEPLMRGVEIPFCHAPVAGFDVIRDASGELLVLEDNLRTPSGLAYAEAARRVRERVLPAPPAGHRNPGDFVEALGATLRAASPTASPSPAIVLLSDGAENSAWFEHELLARRLEIPVVRPQELRVANGVVQAKLGAGAPMPIDVIYRRTDEDLLHDRHGRATWLAQTLLDPVRRGTVAVVNGFGSGVGDDKLTHAYVEDMIRFYLEEEPVLRSVHTYDLGVEDTRRWALGRREELVFKPRSGHGGQGVVVGPHAEPRERRTLGRRVSKSLGSFVAQETIPLSRHPTVAGGRLEPRHVDLRVFALHTGQGFSVVPTALTRVAMGAGDLVVNSSQGGGGKDTWILK
jgi:uncharacterized circularly permuted ATP-grasp superfamily protein